TPIWPAASTTTRRCCASRGATTTRGSSRRARPTSAPAMPGPSRAGDSAPAQPAAARALGEVAREVLDVGAQRGRGLRIEPAEVEAGHPARRSLRPHGLDLPGAGDLARVV